MAFGASIENGSGRKDCGVKIFRDDIFGRIRPICENGLYSVPE
jgi:hypothetical protein